MNNVIDNIIEKKYDTTLTGYTLSIVGTINTGNEIIPPIQGFPSINYCIIEEDQDIFPDTREELFIDQKLQEFYHKKGYK